MEWQRVEEFRRIPPELRPDALAAIQTIFSAEKRPRYQLIGDEAGDAPGV